MIISRTPFRVSFFGGGTDYPVWYRQHGGAVLATAIDKYCYLNCRYLPPFFEHHSRVIYTVIENVQNNRDIRHPAVRACLEWLGIEEGVEIHHDADLPARTGLGTSSSFVAGLLQALHALRDEPVPTGIDLARRAIQVERDLLGQNVGSQDQVTVACGGLNHIVFSPDGSIAVHPVTISRERLEQLQDRLFLFFTGFSRNSSDIAGEQIANTPKRAAELEELAALVGEGLDVLQTPSRDLDDFGRLLDHGWRLKRRLSSLITNPDLDAIYDSARAAGAIGGKLLGAGGGGFMLFYVPPARQEAFRERMRRWLYVPFRFAQNGSELVLRARSTRFEPRFRHDRIRAYSHPG